ncbi:alpha/beta fold hydrolase [candidate division KSB1 bacterium]|nr:alpha/beta fold hydrolase [candidate division KSB1 bacterium]
MQNLRGAIMIAFLNILSWIFFVIFAFIAFLVLGMGGRLQFVLILAIALILLPPFRYFVKNLAGVEIRWWAFVLVGVILWGGVMLSFILNPAKSIYKSEKYKSQLLKIYDEKLAQWPVPYESRYIDTKYGKIHVITSGPQDGYPVFLINASGLSGWSWIHNVELLNTKYRTFAIDNVGEGGKNEMIAPGMIPKNGREIADFYSEISDTLGIEKSHVIGASIGGFIATNYALHSPEKVDKLVLLGSMGYGTTLRTIIAMTLAQGFPLKPIQEATFRWAFGNDETVNQSFGEWFRVYMKGLIPTPIVPTTFNPEELRNVQVSTLAYFGTKDGVIGDVKDAEKLALNIPNVQIEIVESGHVIGAELPELVNPAILEFFESKIAEK